MHNIKFAYLYRDAGNYKQWAEVIFSNPDKLQLVEIARSLRNAFLERDLFIAQQARLPEVFPFVRGDATSDDHCFHEFHSVELTGEDANDQHLRSISQLIADVENAARQGWVTFDPQENYAVGTSF
jgi:hypothetical protein